MIYKNKSLFIWKIKIFGKIIIFVNLWLLKGQKWKFRGKNKFSMLWAQKSI